MNHPDRNYHCRISDRWRLKGLKAVVMENELLRITVLADKGSDIYEFLYKPRDIDFMWRSPAGLRNPYRALPSNITTSGAFLDFYEGTWQEILPSGGAPCTYKGVAYGQHGEVSNLPWRSQIIKDHPEEVSCLFSVRTVRTPLYLEKILTLRRHQPLLLIEERLVNESPEEVELMWGHHLAFGEPFLNEHCRLDTPAGKIWIHPESYSGNHRFECGKYFPWPIAVNKEGRKVDFQKIPPRSQRSEDMTYLLDLREPWYALTHTKQKVGFALRWSGEVFKYLWYWQVFGGGEGYPWYSRTYNIGLEPWTSIPTSGLAAAAKQGTQLVVPPGGVVAVTLLAVVYEGKQQVESISPAGEIR